MWWQISLLGWVVILGCNISVCLILAGVAVEVRWSLLPLFCFSLSLGHSLFPCQVSTSCSVVGEVLDHDVSLSFSGGTEFVYFNLSCCVDLCAESIRCSAVLSAAQALYILVKMVPGESCSLLSRPVIQGSLFPFSCSIHFFLVSTLWSGRD